MLKICCFSCMLKNVKKSQKIAFLDRLIPHKGGAARSPNRCFWPKFWSAPYRNRNPKSAKKHVFLPFFQTPKNPQKTLFFDVFWGLEVSSRATRLHHTTIIFFYTPTSLLLHHTSWSHHTNGAKKAHFFDPFLTPPKWPIFGPSDGLKICPHSFAHNNFVVINCFKAFIKTLSW